MSAAISRALDFVTSLGGCAKGITLLALGLGYLMDFMEVRTTVVEYWPEVGALLPLAALGVATCGLILGGADAWRWFAPRRPSERFRRLVPKIEKHGRYHQTGGPQRGRGFVENKLLTAAALEQVGVGLPHDQVDVLLLRDLAEQGKLRSARKKYPLTKAKKDEIKSIEQGLRGRATPR